MVNQQVFLDAYGRMRYLESQPCIRAVKAAKLPKELRIEIDAFIDRNTLPRCGGVSPHCLKAHMVKKANELGLRKKTLDRIKRLFRSRIGYKGYYLDSGKLCRV